MMPSSDIGKCAEGCEKQDTCWRWLAPPHSYQSYFDFKPNKDGDCEHYWESES